MNRSRRSAALSAFVAPLILVAVLTGCTSSSDGLDASTGQELQNSVLLVGNAAADGDTAGAIAALDGLAAQLTAAEAAGTVSAARAAEIRAAIDRVRSDLAPVVETPTPEPVATVPADPVTPTDDDDDGDDEDSGNNGNGNGNSGNNGNGNGKKDK